MMVMMMIMVHHCQRADEYMYVISVELELLFLLMYNDPIDPWMLILNPRPPPK